MRTDRMIFIATTNGVTSADTNHGKSVNDETIVRDLVAQIAAMSLVGELPNGEVLVIQGTNSLVVTDALVPELARFFAVVTIFDLSQNKVIVCVS